MIAHHSILFSIYIWLSLKGMERFQLNREIFSGWICFVIIRTNTLGHVKMFDNEICFSFANNNLVTVKIIISVTYFMSPDNNGFSLFLTARGPVY